MMKYLKSIIVCMVICLAILFLMFSKLEEKLAINNDIKMNSRIQNNKNEGKINEGIIIDQKEVGVLLKTSEELESQNNIPLRDTLKRKIIKPFGIWITPDSSPVQPEKFKGYHTGLDLEIFQEEISAEVFVRAICDGDIVRKGFVAGYGGVVVQECLINKKPATVLYGHLDMNTIKKEDNVLVKNEIIGQLGKGNSNETDYERKHLHMGIHRGTIVDLRGYVSSEKELVNWIDPCEIIACSIR